MMETKKAAKDKGNVGAPAKDRSEGNSTVGRESLEDDGDITSRATESASGMSRGPAVDSSAPSGGRRYHDARDGCVRR